MPTKGPVASAFPEGTAQAPASTPPARMVVFGSAEFANDEYIRFSQFLQVYASGANLLLNAVAWALEDEALAPVRAKQITARPLDAERIEKSGELIKWGNILGIPLGILLVRFFLRWRYRKAKRAAQTL